MQAEAVLTVLQKLQGILSDEPQSPQQLGDALRVLIAQGAIDAMTIAEGLQHSATTIMDWAEQKKLRDIEDLPRLQYDILVLIEDELNKANPHLAKAA